MILVKVVGLASGLFLEWWLIRTVIRMVRRQRRDGYPTTWDQFWQWIYEAMT